MAGLNRFILPFVLLGMLAAAVAAPGVRAARRDGDPPRAFALKAARILGRPSAADGAAFITDGWIEVKSGKIIRVATGPIPSWLDVVDLGDVSVLPGLVSMSAEAFAPRDGKDVGPGWIAADGFDPYADFAPLWRHGITTARLGTPAGRFVGGAGSVVQLGGDPESARVLVRVADLQVSFSDRGGRGAPDVGGLAYPSSSDIPFVPGAQARPFTRLGRVLAVEKLLADAARVGADPSQKPSTPKELDDRAAALADLLAAKPRLRFEARRAAEIVQAVRAGKLAKLDYYIAGADEAHLVDTVIGGERPKFVYEIDTDLADFNARRFDPVNPMKRSAHGDRYIAARGPVVIDSNTDDLLYAVSLVYGQDTKDPNALGSVTSEAAEMLGLGASKGAIRGGADADFAVVSGIPFDAGSFVQETWVAGKRVWSRAEEAKVAAKKAAKKDEPSGGTILVRAGKIYDGRGHWYEDGEVLIEDGAVVAVGTRVSHPKNARIVDAGADAVVTPGFIDAHGHMGLGSDRTRLGPDASLAELYAVDRPEFRHLAKAGITTVVVAQRDADPMGAPFAAVKTSGDSRADLVTKPIAGVKIAVPRLPTGAEQMLDGALKRAKAYYDAWKKYEEEYRKWKSGEAVTTAPAAAEQKSEKKEEKKDDPITGTWEARMKASMIPDQEEKVTLKLRLADDNTITGSAEGGGPMAGDEEIGITGKLDGKTVTLILHPPATDLPIEIPELKAILTLDGPEHMAGKMDIMGMMEITIDATRIEKGAPAIKVAKTKKKEDGPGPKKPKVEPALEPWRDVFDGKAGLLLVASTAQQIRTALKVVPAYQVPVTILGGEEAWKIGAEAAGKMTVVLGPNLLRAKRGGTIGFADELDRQGIAFAWGSSADTQAANLPRLAAAAVREGLSADAALQALTSTPAKALRLDDKVGSLTRGRDGDLLIFSGEPFDTGSRLLHVFVRGKEVQ